MKTPYEPTLRRARLATAPEPGAAPRNEQYHWDQGCETTYDNYMIGLLARG